MISTKNPAYRRFNVEVSWIKPPDNWVKLNSNGASLRNSGKAGGGCVIKDHRGAWVKGCVRSIGQASSCAVELWALRDGLNLCISMFCPNVIVELDALLIVNMLSRDYAATRHLLPLVDDCRVLLNRTPHHQVKHCYREANSVADVMASYGAKMEDDFVVFDSPPAFVLSLVAQDAANYVYLGCVWLP